MIALLAATALMIEPAPHTDRTLSCTDPQHARAYRVPAQWIGYQFHTDAKTIETVGVETVYDHQVGQTLLPSKPIGWAFVHPISATCHEVEDHQSHWTAYFGNRHSHKGPK